MILSTVVPVQRKIRATVRSSVIVPVVISMVFMVVQVGTVFLSFLLQGVGKRDLWVMNDLFYPHYDAWTTVYDSQLNY